MTPMRPLNPSLDYYMEFEKPLEAGVMNRSQLEYYEAGGKNPRTFSNKERGGKNYRRRW